MNVQIIEKDGKPDYAILPYAEYLALINLLEDKVDREAIETYQSGKEETWPADVAEALIDGTNPIKVFRKYRGMTQQELADKVGKSKIYIAKLEGGERKGSVGMMTAIARVLGIDLDQLVTS